MVIVAFVPVRFVIVALLLCRVVTTPEVKERLVPVAVSMLPLLLFKVWILPVAKDRAVQVALQKLALVNPVVLA